MSEQHIAAYLDKVKSVFATGVTTEHSFRPALQFLFDGISTDVRCINEPKAVVDVGRPDFVFKRTIGQNKAGQQITIGHCEAKDIDKDINPRSLNPFNKGQYERYVKGLPNLVYTNGLDFRFYVKGEFIREISIADLSTGIAPQIINKPDNFAALFTALKDFTAERLQTITSAKSLAQMMAGKAVLIKTVLANTLLIDKDLESELAGQYKAFKDQLIHDLSIEGFADIYAETIAYGLFAARLHDNTPEDFSRQEALELLPKSNPFLRNLFSYVAGPTLDARIRRDIDELAEIFQASNLQTLFKNFGNFTKRNDPFIHFYETFLAEYNPKKRKARGVWYTPEPVVNFIVRAVDDVLKSEFGLRDGLADTSKISVKIETGESDKKGKAKTEMREMHKVQILDPATGTGTFLAEVIKQIAPTIHDIAPAGWSKYVEDDLIPRLHGFELLMASYAMCHMKLDMMLTEMGYTPTAKNPPRLNVFLTNSLEEGEREVRDLFMARWLSDEARGANKVKRDKPIMCIIGNPPYSVSSSNKSPFIETLVTDYKKDLNERNIQPLSDDYIKFIRLSQHLIDKNGEGVLAFITNNSYLDGLIHRQMRKYLLEGFDKIYVIDLHGSSKKKERAPDGSPDKNVFDIMQGVSIIVAVKTKAQKKKGALASVKHLDIWGARHDKNESLFDLNIRQRKFKKIQTPKPNYFFVPKDFKGQAEYEIGFKVAELMQNLSGIKTGNDKQLVKMKKNEFDVNIALDINMIRQYDYRAFDYRHIYYDRNMIQRDRFAFAKHFVAGKNLGLCFKRSRILGEHQSFKHIFVSKNLFDLNFFGDQSYFFPLYLYPDESATQSDAFSPTERTVNMEPKIRAQIEKAGTDKTHGTPDEVAIFDYIYGVLHCPAYRETYKEFLKIDFPRVPYPASPKSFWDISTKGRQLRKLHLMEDAAIGETPYKFEGTANADGDSVVGKPIFTPGLKGVGTVHINKTQYFEDVPLVAWEFYIGGYQPAQKWLKDRKGRTLSFEDIRHYQKIIKILCETDRIMQTIDMPLDVSVEGAS